MFDDYLEITKREILASIAIVAIMIIIGVVIGGKINDAHNDKMAVYNKALKITNHDIFEYGMSTDVGNAFVKGTVEAIDTVTFPELNSKDKYMYVKKEREEYTMHTRIVTTTDSNGHTHSHTETYWTWDYAGEEHLQSTNVTFVGVKFPIDKFKMPSSEYIETIYDDNDSDVRYVYYGITPKHKCIIFTNLKNNTINNTDYHYTSATIQELIDSYQTNVGIVLFWIFWIILTAVLVAVFYHLKGDWLE